MDAKATAAALISPALRAQIRQLCERDGCTSDDISAMLGVPAAIVEEVLSGRQGGEKIVQQDSVSTSAETVLSGRASAIEDAFGADADADAVATLRELCLAAKSDAVRAMAAQKILEYRTGALRPKTAQQLQVGITVDTMNVLIQQAVAAHQAQLAPPAPQLEPISEDSRANN